MKRLVFILLAAGVGWLIHLAFPAEPFRWHELSAKELADFQASQLAWKTQMEAQGRDDYKYYHDSALQECGAGLCHEFNCDVDGDGRPDHIFLKTTDDHKLTRIYAQLTRHMHKEYMLAEQPYIDGGFGISAAKPGDYSQAGGLEETSQPTQIHMNTCGVQLSYYGKSSVLYYYIPKSDSFGSLWTSD